MKQTANTVDYLHNGKFGSVFVSVIGWARSLSFKNTTKKPGL